jgi:hypothetical protein
MRNYADFVHFRLTWKSPWCDDLDVWLEAVESQLEPNLIIALASAAMGYESWEA